MRKNGFTFRATKGFTFIELLVSITIVLLLSSVAMVSYQSSNKKARDNKRRADLEQARAALEMYRTDNGEYPASLSELAPEYLNELPDDPKDYSYYYGPSGTPPLSYELCAYMESGGTDTCSGDCAAPEDCNYRLTNP